MKYGCWFDYDQTYTFVALFRELVRRDPSAQVTGIVAGDRYVDHAVTELPAGSKIISFYRWLAEAKDRAPTPAERERFDAFDRKHRLARVAYSDRFVTTHSYDDLVRQYTFLISAFEGYLNEEKPDVLIFPGIISQYTHLLYLVARDMNIEVMTPYSIGVEDLYANLDNPYFDLPEIWSLYREMKQGRAQPTDDERQWAQQFIDKIRAGGPPYPAWSQPIEDRKFKFPGLRQGLRYLINHYRHDRNDFTQATPWTRLRRVLTLRGNRRRSQVYFQTHDTLPEHFALFPLHYAPEIATLFLSQYEQTSFIDIIVRQLPLGMPLVVKEHWGMMGQRDWRFFRDLKARYPNLILVEPKTSINYLARRAEVIITLSGTIILEALILGRPVVFTSDSRFGGFGLGVFTHNILDFHEAIAEARAKAPASDEQLIQMLSSVHRCCGRYVLIEPLGHPETLAPDNMARIADAIEQRWRRRSHPPLRAAGI